MHNPSDIFMGKNIVFPSWGPFLEKVSVTFRAQNQIFKSKYKEKDCRSWLRLQVVPIFSSVTVAWAKCERTWKSPHTRKGGTWRGEWKMRDYRQSLIFLSPSCVSPFLVWGDFHACSSFACSTIPEEKLFHHVRCKSIETSILHVNNNSFTGPLIIGTFKKQAPEHSKWDQNLQFQPFSEMTSIPII